MVKKHLQINAGNSMKNCRKKCVCKITGQFPCSKVKPAGNFSLINRNKIKEEKHVTMKYVLLVVVINIYAIMKHLTLAFVKLSEVVIFVKFGS